VSARRACPLPILVATRTTTPCGLLEGQQESLPRSGQLPHGEDTHLPRPCGTPSPRLAVARPRRPLGGGPICADNGHRGRLASRQLRRWAQRWAQRESNPRPHARHAQDQCFIGGRHPTNLRSDQPLCQPFGTPLTRSKPQDDDLSWNRSWNTRGSLALFASHPDETMGRCRMSIKDRVDSYP
jgi:hypothetical protein